MSALDSLLHIPKVCLPIFNQFKRFQGQGISALGQYQFQDFAVLGAGKAEDHTAGDFFDVLIRGPSAFLNPQGGVIVKGDAETAFFVVGVHAEEAAVRVGAKIDGGGDAEVFVRKVDIPYS